MTDRKLIQIKDMHLYVAFTDNAAECAAVLKIFKQNNIKCITMNYGDDVTGQQATLSNLNTWNLGDLTNPYQATLTDFPILQWTECYDDWTVQVHLVQGWDAMKKTTALSGIYPVI